MDTKSPIDAIVPMRREPESLSKIVQRMMLNGIPFTEAFGFAENIIMRNNTAIPIKQAGLQPKKLFG